MLNFYIFKQYGEITDIPTREYMQYFATRKCESEKQKRIERLVEQYRMDPIAKKAYMTFEQELNIRSKKWIEQGKKEGELQGKKEAATNMLKVNMPLQQVASLSGLSLEEVKAIKIQ